MSANKKKKSGVIVTTASEDEKMLAALLTRLREDGSFRTQLRRAMGSATAADRLALRPDPEADLLTRLGGLPTYAHEKPGAIERGEGGERAVEVYDLGDGHSSGMRFEVRVVHPEFAHHQGNAVPRSRQAPEIFRFGKKREAHAMAHALALALGAREEHAAEAFPGAHVPIPEQTEADAPVSIDAEE